MFKAPPETSFSFFNKSSSFMALSTRFSQSSKVPSTQIGYTFLGIEERKFSCISVKESLGYKRRALTLFTWETADAMAQALSPEAGTMRLISPSSSLLKYSKR